MSPLTTQRGAEKKSGSFWAALRRAPAVPRMSGSRMVRMEKEEVEWALAQASDDADFRRLFLTPVGNDWM